MTGVNLFHEDLVGCFVAEAFSGTMVEAMHGEGDVLVRDAIERHRFREELADESVPVLVGTTLPGALRVGKVEVSTESLGNALVLGELLAIVRRPCVHIVRKRRPQRNHGVGDRLGGLERHMDH